MTKKKFDAVKFMRQQRDRISKELSEMSKDEIVAYFNNKKSEKAVAPCS